MDLLEQNKLTNVEQLQLLEADDVTPADTLRLLKSWLINYTTPRCH